jgi:hypothetical protein
MLLSTSLVATALLVLGYIVGSEWCLPAARYALRTGDTQDWHVACGLVTAGEWAVLTIAWSLLLLLDDTWHPGTVLPAGQYLGPVAYGLVFGAVCWELAGRTRKRHARILGTSLDLVLPPGGAQRECFERLRQRLETGTRTDRDRIIRMLAGLDPS